MSDTDIAQIETFRDRMVDRAIRLFEFLGRAQQLKRPPPRTFETYERDGSVFWLGKLPHHRAVTAAHRGGDPQPDDVLLTIDRVPRLDPPAPDEELIAWLNGPRDDPNDPPQLRDTLIVFDDEASADTEWDQTEWGQTSSRHLAIDDQPDVRACFDRWRKRWQTWADQELLDRPVRALYGDLFSTYVRATGNPEEYELVAGIGCLAWTPPNHPPLKRHLLTAPVTVNFHDDSGQLTVQRTPSAEAVKVELDMLDPGFTSSSHLNEVRAQARLLEVHPLHRDEIGVLVRRLVHSLDADGEYHDQDDAPRASSHAVAAFAPAIILRKRSQQGLVEIVRTIVSQLTASGEVPDGILPLIDSDHRPHTTAEHGDGALVLVDDEPFLPLPVNAVQLRIIRQGDPTSTNKRSTEATTIPTPLASSPAHGCTSSGAAGKTEPPTTPPNTVHSKPSNRPRLDTGLLMPRSARGGA